METFLLVLAALFPVVNPPGSALVFFSMTKDVSASVRRSLARRVAINSFFVMAASLIVGALVLRVYGISVPVLRVAGGLIVATSGWKLLNEGSAKGANEQSKLGQETEYSSLAFYPLTMPLTTGPGTIAVLISLGFSPAAYSDYSEDLRFLLASLLATIVIAVTIYVCFVFADRVEKVLGRGGTDIAVRLSALILFCLGVQIIWTGIADLLESAVPRAPR